MESIVTKNRRFMLRWYWRTGKMNWTPNLGWWFVDAGAGAFVCAGYGQVNFGVSGTASYDGTVLPAESRSCFTINFGGA